MANYIGNDIGQRILDNQDAMNERVSQVNTRLTIIETQLKGFEIPALWKTVRGHGKIIHICWGAGLAIGWFAKVILGK